MIHKHRHELTGTQVVVATNGKKKTIHDWFDRIFNSSWKDLNTIATLIYKTRVARHKLPVDNEVVLCDDGALYHVSEVFPIGSPILTQGIST